RHRVLSIVPQSSEHDSRSPGIGMQLSSSLPDPAVTSRFAAAAAPDASGGAFVAWWNGRPAGGYDLEGSRGGVNRDRVGPLSGVQAFTGASDPLLGNLVADGEGGALLFVARPGGVTLQRVGAALDLPWGAGVPLAPPGALDEFSIAATGDGGAIVAW